MLKMEDPSMMLIIGDPFNNAVDPFDNADNQGSDTFKSKHTK